MIVFIGYTLIIIGLFFIITSVVGIIRVKNDYQMLHIGAINDMVGIPLFLVGLAIISFIEKKKIFSFKILLLVFLIYIVLPISGYILIKIMFFIEKKKTNIIE